MTGSEGVPVLYLLQCYSGDTIQYLTVTGGDVEKIWKIGQSCSPLGSIRLVVSNHDFISLN